MRLTTARLVLRPFCTTDSETFQAYRNDPEVARYQGWDVPFTEAQAQTFIEWAANTDSQTVGDWYQMAIERRDTGEMMGDVGFYVRDDDPRQAKIGYTLARLYWGNGYAQEAVLAVLGYLFRERNMHRVVADCDTENTASYHLLERLGFRREAHFVESDFFKGRYASEFHYAMLQREFNERIKDTL
jgi:aminoglycoside 6'-N-acetyltransferase